MRVRAINILAAATIGTIGSVLLSVATAFFHPPEQVRGIVKWTELERDCWVQHAPSGSAAEPTMVIEASGFGARTSSMFASNQSYAGTVQVVVRGWPMFSVWGYRTAMPGAKTPAEIKGVLSLNDPFQKDHLVFIATRPLWLGAIVNTLFWTVVALAAMEGLGALRRWRRRGKGSCERCGYLLYGRELCPECGAAVGGFRTSA